MKTAHGSAWNPTGRLAGRSALSSRRAGWPDGPTPHRQPHPRAGQIPQPDFRTLTCSIRLPQTVFIGTDTGKDATNEAETKLGVQRGTWSAVLDMPSLSTQLLQPSPKRAQGTHEAQPVLVRAGPGTGKTWSLQQLAWLLANDLQSNPEAVKSVPLLVRVQRIAGYAASSKREGFDNLLLAYIDKEHSGDDKKVILHAYKMRSLIVILDGIDEAAAIKGYIEDLVLFELAPWGIRTVVSSRPEV